MSGVGDKNMTKTGTSLSDAVSIEIATVSGTEADGRIQLRLTLYSLSIKVASVALEYRLDDFSEWMSDAKIVASNAKMMHGNKMIGLPCSQEGAVSNLIWDHAANGLAEGSRCTIRVTVLPSAYVGTKSNNWSNFDTLFPYNEAIHDRPIEGDMIGLVKYGGLIMLEEHYVRIVDAETRETMMSTPYVNLPRHAVGSRDGGLIVVEANGNITEYNDDGLFVRNYNGSAIASGEPRLACDFLTGNVLVSGDSIAQVTELAWGGFGHGTILWTHGSGTPGSGTNDLDSPSGIAYGDSVDVVAICDAKNNRIVINDRTNLATPVSIVESVEIDEQTVYFQKPIACFYLGGSLHVCEESGIERHFSSSPLTHPALARSGLATSGEDSLPQYAGMRFVPLVRSIQ
jgi:hypothetical protein